MPGLNLIVLSDDAERLRGALVLALTQMALGAQVRLFLQLDAVRLLAPPLSAPRDADHAAHGLPGLAALIEEALDAGDVERRAGGRGLQPGVGAEQGR